MGTRKPADPGGRVGARGGSLSVDPDSDADVH